MSVKSVPVSFFDVDPDTCTDLVILGCTGATTGEQVPFGKSTYNHDITCKVSPLYC